MPFDVEAARKAGYSDQEIADYLGEQNGFDVKGALNSGYSHKDVLEFLSKNERLKKAASQPAQPSADPGYFDPENPWGKEEYVAPKEEKGAMSWGEVGKKALGNVVPSALGVGGDFLNAVLHPIDTAKNLGDIIDGVENKLVNALTGRKKGDAPTAWQETFGVTDEDEAKANAVGDYFVQRYGGLENFKRSLATDPVGVIADLSTIFTGGAGAGKTAASLAKAGSTASKAAGLTRTAERLGGTANTLEKFADAASLAGRATDPIFGTAELAGKLVAPRLYQSALMPKTTLKPAERERVIQTGLREGITPTRGGYDKADAIVTRLNEQVNNIIDNASKSGATIDPIRVGNNAFEKTYNRFLNQATPTGDLETILRDTGDFVDTWGAQPLSPMQAQRIKTGTYRELKDKDFRPGEPTSASKATQRNIASELRQEIENIVPEVKALNQREGNLIALMDQIEPALGRQGNWRMMALPASIGANVGLLLGNPVAAILMGLLGSQLRNPWAKAQLAIMGHRGTLPRLAHNLATTAYAGGTADNVLGRRARSLR